MPISSSSRKPIGITLGDPAGIGPEVAARALARPAIRRLGPFIVIGDRRMFKKYCPVLYRHCSFIDVSAAPRVRHLPGQPNRASARSALASLHIAVKLVQEGKLHALVTAPVSKKSIRQIEPSFVGHTEFLAEAFGIKNVGMLFVGNSLRTIIVTRHIPLNKVSTAIHPKKIFDTIALTHTALTRMFGIRNPKIAVCGLNPHAGEGGTIGQEELTKILPAIRKAQRKNIDVHGPFPADTLFSPKRSKQFDAIVAMYHDQGLAPVKTLYPQDLVNLTIGLPFVRTSPAHGTAFDIAGKGKADPSSMCAAIQLAIRLSP